MRPHPDNPRRAKSEQEIKNLAESIRENPTYFESRPILLSDRTGELVIIGGERRSEAARLLGLTEVPSFLFHGLTYEREIEIMNRDNSHAGVWDGAKLERLAGKFGDAKLKTWTAGVEWRNVPKWDGEALKTDKDQETGDYGEFVDKFKPKLTTDDCYTPEPVYNAVRQFVNDHLLPLEGVKVLRPFFPGGDYQKEEYPAGTVVIDNPPFSIFTPIVRWYMEHNVPFFLFSPALTGFVARDIPGLTYVVVGADVIYENGALVRTSFITNLRPDTRIWISHELYQAIEDAQVSEDKRPPKFLMPKEVITQARIMKLADTFDFEVPAVDVLSEIKSLKDKETGKKVDLFGGGYIISEHKANELKERERERERERE